MKKVIRFLSIGLILGFILLNVVTYNHAYCFTHFSETSIEKRQKPEDLSFFQKLSIAFWGVEIPRPMHSAQPEQPYESVFLESDEKLEGWLIDTDSANTTVLLFHGYSSNKSTILNYSDAFRQMGYRTFLVDFRGGGGSEGNVCTIGFHESKDVKVAFDYIKNRFPTDKIVLYGPSMGAVSIMKSVHDFSIQPDALVIECPFGTMLQTTKIRFKAMGLPSFPFAQMLLFYGGLQNDFDAFAHQPIEYAHALTMPTILLYGKHDKRVTLSEVEQIFKHLKGEKEFVQLTNSGHQNYLWNDALDWEKTVRPFLKKHLVKRTKIQ